jgi:hypothetical protein
VLENWKWITKVLICFFSKDITLKILNIPTNFLYYNSYILLAFLFFILFISNYIYLYEQRFKHILMFCFVYVI